MQNDRLLARVEAVRAFNRFWTARIGVLDASHLGSPFSLAEARVLFELVKEGGGPMDVAALRKTLALDAGYLSRMLAALAARKLVTIGASEADLRQKVVRLTPTGRNAQRGLDRNAVLAVQAILETVGEKDQERAIEALGAVRAVFGARDPRSPTQLVTPRAGDFGWVVERHGALYAEEYGWDERFEGLVAEIVAEYVSARDARSAAWIARVGEERAGCVFCTKKDQRTAQLRLLLVEPRFRGAGIGQKLVCECLTFARRRGYGKMVLWTNDVLAGARRLYERAGFELVAEKRHASFGKELVGQTWEISLRGQNSARARPSKG